MNTLAWHFYADYANGTTPIHSELLTLGPYASPAQVYQAMCYDELHIYARPPATIWTEELAQAYYGWRFAGGTPVQQFEIQGCPTPKPTPSRS